MRLKIHRHDLSMALQRQGSFDAIRHTWIAIDTKRRKVERKKKDTKNKEELTNVNRFNHVTIRKKKNNLHRCHSQYKLHSRSLMKL